MTAPEVEAQPTEQPAVFHRRHRERHPSRRGAALTLALAATALVAVGLGRLPLPAPVRAAFAVVAALAVPMALGGVLWPCRWWKLGPEAALRFGVGSLYLVVLAWAAEAAGIFSITLLAAGWLVAVALSCAWAWRSAALSLTAVASRARRALVPRPSWIAPVIAVAGPIGAVSYWRARSPYPFQTTWDGFAQMAPIWRMLHEDRFSLSLKQLSPVFTFDPYLPGYHLSLATVSRVSGVSVLGQLWAGPFIVMALLGAAIYSFARHCTGSRSAACGAALLSGLLCTARGPVNPLNELLPASEAVAFVPLALLALLEPRRRDRRIRSLAAAGALVAVHGLMGLLAVGIVVVVLVLSAEPRRARGYRVGVVAVVTVLGVVAGVLFGLARDLRSHLPRFVWDPTTFYGSLTAASQLRARVAQVAVQFPDHLPGALVLAAVVLFALTRLRRDPRARLVAATLVVLVGDAVPIVGLERLLGFFVWALPVGVAAILLAVRGALTVAFRRRARWIAGVLAVAVAIASTPWLIGPLRSWRQFQRRDTSEHSLQTSIAPYELAALPAFAREFGRHYPLATDPELQQMGEGLAGFTSLGGVATPTAVEMQLVLSLVQSSPRRAARRLADLQQRIGAPYLLVVTARTERWAVLANRRYVRPGIDPGVLGYPPVFRPWDFSRLPDRTIRRTKSALLAPITASGCVQRSDDRGEIIAFLIDCPTNSS